MIADAIQFILSNIPTIMFVAAVVVAFLTRRPQSTPERYLNWLLLLSVGVSGIWAGVFHIFFPSVASGQIGWTASPFETEIGIADAAMGIVAVLAFWRSLPFKAAIALTTILFYIGVIIGHFYQAFAHNDFSPDNFGLLLVVTILNVVLLGWSLWGASRQEKLAGGA